MDKSMHSEIYKIWRSFQRLECLDPINEKKEKIKFFNCPNYNPIFKYRKIRWGKMLKKLNLIQNKNNDRNQIINRMVKDKARTLEDQIHMLESIGKKEFTKYSIKVHGKPNQNMVKKALSILRMKERIREDPKIISAHKVAGYLQKKSKALSYSWKVRLSEHLAPRAKLISSRRLLLIKKDEMFSKSDVKKLFYHEMMTHALRYENGLKQKIDLFAIGTKNYISTEEGLAIFNEEKHQCLSLNSLKRYAAATLAVYLALTHSFREVYNELLHYLSKNEAYAITVRVKRGLVDTSQKGAFTKDHVYLTGYEQVKRKARDINYLLLGKVSVKDIPKIKKLIQTHHVLFLRPQ